MARDKAKAVSLVELEQRVAALEGVVAILQAAIAAPPFAAPERGKSKPRLAPVRRPWYAPGAPEGKPQ